MPIAPLPSEAVASRLRESNQTSMMNIIESRSRESNRIQFANGTSRNQNERKGRAKEKGIQRSGEKGAFPRVSFVGSSNPVLKQFLMVWDIFI
jgi:preprotein translocase subunit SecF